MPKVVMGRPKTAMGRKIDSVANLFGVNARTVKKWQDAGCDITDPGEILAFRTEQASKKRGGKGSIKPVETAEQALNGKRLDQAGMLNFDLIQNLPPPAGEGAAAALKRLQGLESIFYSRQLEALAKGRNDLISYALSDYKRITQTLLEYERQVELAMRDSGQLIARGDAEKGAMAVARWFRLGWRMWLSSCTGDLMQFVGDPRAFKAKAEETFAEITKTVFAKAREAKIELPAWALHAIKEEYRAEIPMEEESDERRDQRNFKDDAGSTDQDRRNPATDGSAPDQGEKGD